MPETVRVLIVEDEVVVAMDIEAELDDHGFKVVGTAARVGKAFELLDTVEVDVALCDVNLLDGTSYDFARACRAKGVKVIFMSGYPVSSFPDDLCRETMHRKPVQVDRMITDLQRLPRV